MKWDVLVQENKQRVIGFLFEADSIENALKELRKHYKYCLDYGILLEYEIVGIKRQDVSYGK